MNKEIKEYFYFTKSERNGIKLLLSMLVLFFFFMLLAPQFFVKENKVDFTKFKTALEKLQANEDKIISQKASTTPLLQNKTISLFSFNPNLASKEQFIALGLSPKQVNTIINYRNKGGKFYKKEDLQKIYGISASDYLRLAEYIDIPSTKKPHENEAKKTSIAEAKIDFELFHFDPNTILKADLQKLGLPDKTINILLNYRAKGAKFRKKEDLAKIYGLTKEDFQRLAPFIRIPENNSAKPVQAKAPLEDKIKETKVREVKTIDINKASVQDWESLRGIGPAYANRIVKFRDKLGGFYKLDQIKETYGLPDSTFLAILPYLVLSPIHTSINLNTAMLDELKAHPYIKWKQANLIINYRKNHGNFSKVEDILKIKAFDQEFFNKIKPYLKIE